MTFVTSDFGLWSSAGLTDSDIFYFHQMIIPNLLLIAGTGTKSGKTTLACRIIEQLRELNITAIKITPHFHETTPGLKSHPRRTRTMQSMKKQIQDSSKDTSRMLKAGASKVYFAKVLDDRLLFVFNRIKDLIPEDSCNM